MTKHSFRINSIVTCVYHKPTLNKSTYQLIARVIGPSKWKILQGGWNHSVTASYSIPHTSDTDYTNFQLYTNAITFPHPELLI